MNVIFDELSAMDFEQSILKPGLQSMTSRQISSGLDLTYALSTITTQQPTEGKLDLLFDAMYDDYIGGQPSAAPRTVPAAQAHQLSRATCRLGLTGTKSKHGFQFITQNVKIINKPTISTAGDCHSRPTPPSPRNSPPPLPPPSPRHSPPPPPPPLSHTSTHPQQEPRPSGGETEMTSNSPQLKPGHPTAAETPDCSRDTRPSVGSRVHIRPSRVSSRVYSRVHSRPKMSADVARSHDGDGRGEDRPLHTMYPAVARVALLTEAKANETDLSEMELKKILIEKMEGNKSIQLSDEQRNLYKALVEAYEADKTILDTYGDSTILKRRREDDDQEGPSAGPNRGSKRQKEGGEQASVSTPSEKATKGAGESTTGTQSRQQSASQSAHAEKPVLTTCQMEETPLPVYETGADDQPIVQTSQHPEWFS
nr:hypothetical protein [Tanacetum cinerariifolium]